MEEKTQNVGREVGSQQKRYEWHGIGKDWMGGNCMGEEGREQ